MKRKIIAAFAVLGLLTGCEKSSAEGTVQVSETVSTAAAVSESTSAVSESTTAESTTKATEETSAETTDVTPDTTEEEKEAEDINGNSADKFYDVYPMRIIYPEKTGTDITAEKAEITKEFKKGEFVVYKFSAAYPVFSGGNEAVMQKINGYIKNYVDEIYNELERETAKTDTSEYAVDDFPYSMCGFIYERAFDGGYGETVLCDVNGNLLSVYFEDYEYGAGAMHGYETPMPMVFDLRTGERVDFNKIIADADGLSEVLSKALYDHLYLYGNWRDTADKYAEYNEKRKKDNFMSGEYLEFGTDKDGDYVAACNKANGRMTVRDGCLSFYLAGYEYGSYADGIRRVNVPIKDVLPYLTKEAQELFAGYASAESKPVNIIETDGEKYFDRETDTVYEWDEPHLYFSDTPGRS